MATVNELQKIASQVRRDIVRMVTASKSGHPGGSLGSTYIMTVLFFNEMKQDPKTWTRDARARMHLSFLPDIWHRFIIQFLQGPANSPRRSLAHCVSSVPAFRDTLP